MGISAIQFRFIATLVAMVLWAIDSFSAGQIKSSIQANELLGKSQQILFKENLGQLSSSFTEGIKYYGGDGHVYFYCKPGMISFIFTKIKNEPDQISEATATSLLSFPSSRDEDRGWKKNETSQPFKIITSRLDFILLGSNPDAQITALGQQEYYENFYTQGNSDKGITQVHTYEKIKYKDIYPNIDMMLKCEENGIEYSFIVHPGGNTNDIKLHWGGDYKMIPKKNGGFKYSNQLGFLNESAPVSFSGTKSINSHFIDNHSIRGFMIGKYDKTKDLVIDPSLNWGTFFGGAGQEMGKGISTDAKGNVYVTGNTTSSTDIASSGASQTSMSGNSDAFVAKFNAAGKLAWSTYFGGTGDEASNSLSADASGNSYVTGFTTSDGMATVGAYQSAYAGNQDAYLAKFGPSGLLYWFTYFGGEKADIGTAVVSDNLGNVAITGKTASTKGIASFWASQTTFGGGLNDDAFLAKFTDNGENYWATYFGGKNEDEGLGLTMDGDGFIYITGFTGSSSGIATANAYQTSYGGGNNASLYDVFLSKFSKLGTLIWSTYFGGSGVDEAYSICTDHAHNVFITGWSYSSNLATSGAYISSNSYGSSNAFLSKFDSSGKLTWSTYFAGAKGVVAYGTGVVTNDSGNVFITGYTTNQFGLATTDAFQKSSAGGDDAFVAEFSTKDSLIWSTFYGGPNIDESNALSTDHFGNVYITGFTQSKTGIANSSAYQISNAGGQDAFITKIRLRPYANDAGIDSIKSPIGIMCARSWPVKFHLKNYGNQVLSTVSIGWSLNGVSQSIYKWTGKLLPYLGTDVSLGSFNMQPGLDTIKAWTISPEGKVDSIPANDTAIILFRVNPRPNAYTGKDTSICETENIILGSDIVPGNSYSWASVPQGFTSTEATFTVKPSTTTLYKLTETIRSTGCTKSDSAKITVQPLPNSTWSVSDAQQYYTFRVVDSSLSASFYSWNFGDSTKSSGYHVTHVFPKNKPYPVSLKVSNIFGCESTSDSSLNILYSVIYPEVFSNIYELTVFPNPGTDKISIRFVSPESNDIKIRIIDILGNLKYERILTKENKGEIEAEINTLEACLEPGNYFVNVLFGDAFITRKIVLLK